MKTQLLAIVAALASTPAWATLGTSEPAVSGAALQPAAYLEEMSATPALSCGKPEQIMFMLRDESGAVVATAIVLVTPDC